MYPKLLIFKLANVSNKDALSICKRVIHSTINKRNKELQYFSKELSIWNFYLNSFLVFTSTSLQNLYHCITRYRCRNHYTLNKKSYLHWRGIEPYLCSQLKKLLLISGNMNYPRKNLIYLKQVYTFQSNQRKFENRKSSLPLKRFIVHFLTTLNSRKPKVR